MNDGKIYQGIREFITDNTYSAHYEAWQQATKVLKDKDISTIFAKPLEKDDPAVIDYQHKIAQNTMKDEQQ